MTCSRTASGLAAAATRRRVASHEVVDEEAFPLDRPSAHPGPPRPVPVPRDGPFLPGVGGFQGDVVAVAEPVR
ncbi:hypothetical protein [Geodermatophilus obscurus]|uniref:Uncharacterized protein n=1 Tax=Geodermatophilus obscurus (strain ATCC 25078 / DSM 43160 / JCM 3152 / CCUG 61914 / KCC A-0152 / KCTC 9177 / NBRC 13315 / NRRL B-3577 / G-20) TaxID=526225 RepID=D2S3X9_GEOOG|nr:hypothetical protein [Geodermatophilus obscurus]ADB73007.1 hypothetical protein Gobs_0201 [Geodermatophilus obscurus DSM 43160]